jgi:hypothetical protein
MAGGHRHGHKVPLLPHLIRDEHIASNEIIECDGDAAAVLAADQILSATTVYTQAEVWDCARMVSIISKKSSAA